MANIGFNNSAVFVQRPNAIIGSNRPVILSNSINLVAPSTGTTQGNNNAIPSLLMTILQLLMQVVSQRSAIPLSASPNLLASTVPTPTHFTPPSIPQTNLLNFSTGTPTTAAPNILTTNAVPSTVTPAATVANSPNLTVSQDAQGSIYHYVPTPPPPPPPPSETPSNDPKNGYDNAPPPPPPPPPPPKGHNPPEPPPPPPPPPAGNYPVEPPPPPPPPKPYEGGKGGKAYGDPHFIGFDGEKYDVMGTANHFYNILSDKNVQFNAKFVPSPKDETITLMGEAGIQVGNDRLFYSVQGVPPTLNGIAMTVGQQAPLGTSGFANWDGSQLQINTGEYNINLSTGGDNGIISDVTLGDIDPFADGVKPHGLLGQTADGVAGKKDNGKDLGKQGGTVISGTVNDYEVADLWGSDTQFNRFVLPAPSPQDVIPNVA